MILGLTSLTVVLGYWVTCCIISMNSNTVLPTEILHPLQKIDPNKCTIQSSLSNFNRSVPACLLKPDKLDVLLQNKVFVSGPGLNDAVFK